jgi:hypothetical protein
LVSKSKRIFLYFLKIALFSWKKKVIKIELIKCRKENWVIIKLLDFEYFVELVENDEQNRPEDGENPEPDWYRSKVDLVLVDAGQQDEQVRQVDDKALKKFYLKKLLNLLYINFANWNIRLTRKLPF